ncbi:MAG: hypothetical protein JM58_01780 [Peptococcaceae bacterium BICA1-8]|nr:MAG: hypothetical protein JM58_01780 [Peptococcaceae bacterium BICA1-8]
MKITIYTATGCTRCKIVKNLMEEKNISYEEKDMKIEGKEEFHAFYKTNRSVIYRGSEGIEFPIITDGVAIRQGIAASIAYLCSGEKLDEFFSVGTLHKEWVDGIHISGGQTERTDEFLEVLNYLKGKNMKLQIYTNGKNSYVLEHVLNNGLADVVIMEVVGPPELYNKILGEEIDIYDIKKSFSLITQFPKFKIYTSIIPIKREDGQFSYLTPLELGETAKFINEGTGSNKIPYFIKKFKPKDSQNKDLKSFESLAANQLFSYRTKARAYQVFTEIEKE